MRVPCLGADAVVRLFAVRLGARAEYDDAQVGCSESGFVIEEFVVRPRCEQRRKRRLACVELANNALGLRGGQPTNAGNAVAGLFAFRRVSQFVQVKFETHWKFSSSLRVSRSVSITAVRIAWLRLTLVP